jgi:prepilin-type N-terminal cleavage/methylation domain-containing protein
VRNGAYTLLELLLVITLLAILAGGTIILMGDTDEEAAEQIAFSEIQEIKQALLQFNRDTGFLPKQGPFDLVTRLGGWVPLGNIPAYVPGAQQVAWFDSPANFWQLYENPLAGTGHPLEQFNPSTGRGWNGPYLSRFGEGLVDAGANLQPDGSGSPTAGAVLPQLFGAADPFLDEPVGLYLVWRASDGGQPHDRWGRPYMLFDLDDTNVARIVSMGRNGLYEGAAADDIVLELFR